MRTIFEYWRQYVRDEWNARYAAVMAPFLLLLLALNYGLGLDDRLMALRSTGWLYFLLSVAYYGVPYYFAALAYAWAYGRFDLLGSRGFWVTSGLALATYAVYCGNVGTDWVSDIVPPDLRAYALRCAANLLPALVGFGLLLLLWLTVGRREPGFFGLFGGTFHPTPYVGFLALGLPIVVAASFFPDFLATYPRYPYSPAFLRHGIAPWQAFGLFQICYGADFVFTELFFRGLLVIGIARWIGQAAVMPMVAWYMVIHFGKPVGEAMASIVGGWALGVVAYRTRSVLGGVLFHLGVAWSMELSAMWQKSIGILH